MKPIYPCNEIVARSLRFQTCQVADQVFCQLKLEERTPSIIRARKRMPSSRARRKTIGKTFSDEELVRIADKMQAMHESPKGLRARIAGWLDRRGE